MKAMPRCWTQDDIQSLSQGSLYLQSNPYLIIMHNSHFQTENCIEGALRKSKTASVRELMVVIIALSKKEFRNNTKAGKGENRISWIVSSSFPRTITREGVRCPLGVCTT